MGEYMMIGMPLASFQKILKIWGDWHSEFAFKLTKHGLFDVRIDDSHCALRQFFLPASHFSVYDVESEWERSVGFKINDFKKSFEDFIFDGVTFSEIIGDRVLDKKERNAIKKDLIVILEANSQGEEISFKLSRSNAPGNGREMFVLDNTEDVGGEKCPVPKFETKVSLSVDPKRFREAVKAVGAIADYALFCTDPDDRDRLFLFADNEGKVLVDFPVVYHSFDELRSIYAVAYLKSIACADPIAKRLILKLTTDMPLKAIISIKDGGYLMYVVAPRIEGGE